MYQIVGMNVHELLNTIKRWSWLGVSNEYGTGNKEHYVKHWRQPWPYSSHCQLWAHVSSQIIVVPRVVRVLGSSGVWKPIGVRSVKIPRSERVNMWTSAARTWRGVYRRMQAVPSCLGMASAKHWHHTETASSQDAVHWLGASALFES